jgi:hypothetical protein
MRWLTSILFSLCLSISIAAHALGLLGRPLSEQVLLVAVAAVGFGVLTFQVYPFFERHFQSSQYKNILLTQTLFAAIATSFFLPAPTPLIRIVNSLACFGLSLALIAPFASGYDQQKNSWVLLSVLLAGPFAYIGAGLVSHFYPGYLTLPLSILCLLLAGSMLYAILGYFREQSTPRTLDLAPVILAFLFALAWIALVLGYPDIFDHTRFTLTPASSALFVAAWIPSPAWLAWTVKIFDERSWSARLQATRAFIFARKNLPGLLLGGMFTLGYTALSFTFNHPGLDQTENFLAIDNFAWMGRLADANGTNIEMRAVHPFAFFIFRPIVWLLSLLFNGDRYAATLLLVPLMGGLCVLLAYRFIKRWSGSETYALLSASLLGASAAHVVFGSFVESYIFSAAALLLFFLLLLDEKTHFLASVAVGTLTFGITITNFIQTFLGYVVARPKFKSIFMFGLLASALSITLTTLHAATFPSALMFFDPAGAGVESDYAIPLIGAPAWKVMGRAMLLTRNIFLYSIVAPQPYILTAEVGGTFPRFNFFKITPGSYSYSSFDGLGKILVAAWLLLLLAAAAAFIWKLTRARRFDLTAAFPLVILFNFALHMTYGYEPFLYAADWTYALVLFVTASLSGLGKQRWFQVVLLLFIALLMINQWNFIRIMLEAISPFFK